jgi:hypothetical protein
VSAKEIKLTSDELEMIKNEVRFRENVTLRLKSVERKVDELNGIKGWVTAHTWALGVLFALISLVIGMCAR